MDWIVEELVGADFGDIRLTGRMMRLVEKLSERPEASVPAACGKSSTAKAAYRFWNNPAVSPRRILAPHVQETARRACEHSVVLVAQDTTEVNLTSHRKTTELGYLGSTECRGLMMHNLLAISPEGTPLGVIHERFWARPPQEQGKRKTRNQRRLGEKESQRWLDGVTEAEAALGEHPHLVVVADRESDLYDLFAMPRSSRTDLLVRVRDRRRRVEHPAKHLGTAIGESPARCETTVEVPRADGRPSRQAILTLRWKRLVLCRPANHLGEAPVEPVPLWFLSAREENPPTGQSPLDWLLASTLPISGLEDALRSLTWYLHRWRIEQFHFVLKSGCRIERLQLKTAESMKAAIATFSIVAWRLLWLTYEARRQPHAACTRVLDEATWQMAYRALHPRTPLPKMPPSLSEATRWIAQLGGFLGRKHDGHPGVVTLWRGWRRLEDLLAGYRLAANVGPNPPPASNEDCG
jgi:hypothetical protein